MNTTEAHCVEAKEGYMGKYVGKRLLQIIPTLLGVIIIVFSIINITPSNPGRMILGNVASQENVDALNHELGYDRPFPLRLANYIWDVVRGDFGRSYISNRPVFVELFARFPVTLELSLLSIAVSLLIGVPLGILSAVKQYSLIDAVSSVSAMFFAAVPSFWLGIMLILLFSLVLGWLPSNWKGDIASLVLPVLTLSIPYAAGFLRLTRSTMLETVRQDYVRTSRAKGASEVSIIWRHALPNAILPVITSAGVSFSYLIGGSVLVESIFGIPGVGLLIIDSIRRKDIPQVMASIIFLSFVFLIVLVLIDVGYAYIDPRIKARYQSKG